MEPKIITIPEKKLVGMYVKTSISYDETAALWQNFMARHKEIKNITEPGFYSMQIYPDDFNVDDFTEDTEFERWAAVEVNDFDNIPEGMSKRLLAGGLYAIFTHVGPVKTFVTTSNYIYGTWLPKSKYKLDKRAHFERLGEKYYGPDHPESEEEIWLPLVEK
ncbi:MAG: GyrI-like domain-containing protein [Leeuwenhoekiella sp.]